jgi:mannosyltransferase OCH1-like enzyme
MKWHIDCRTREEIRLHCDKILPNNFDWEYYLEKNQDLNLAGIDSESTAIEHFVLCGQKENRIYSKPPIKNTTINNEYISLLSDIRRKILIKIPTLRRPQQLIESINSFLDNAHNKDNIYFVITVDINDELTNNNKVIEQLNSYKNLTICQANTESKVDAYNLHIDPVQFDILILSSDDMIVMQKSYDQIIIDTMNKHFPDLDGVLWFDTTDSQRTNTLAIIGKKLYDQIKPIYKYCYTSYYCDDEFGQVTMKLGKMIRIEQTLIQHKIPDHLIMSDDSTYLKSLSFSIKDKTVYKIRKRVQFDIPGAESPIKAHNIPKSFIEPKRNITYPNYWLVPESRYDDPISSMDLYVLEEMDKSVSQMNKDVFIDFARNYFRDFRWTIPHVIHQIWLGGPIPPPIKEMMDTFSVDYIKRYPGSRYILWDDNKLKNFKMINKDLFDQEDKYDCKSDIARVEILNKFGGFYIDADTVWLGNRPMSNAPSSYGITIAYEKEGTTIGNRYLNNKTKRCANGVFGSTIQNPIMAFIIGQMRKSYNNNRQHGVVVSTGPDFVQSLFDSLKPELSIEILNHKYFYPCWWCIDPKNNPNYKEFLETKNMSNQQIAQKYPEAILFHKGFTSAIDGIES